MERINLVRPLLLVLLMAMPVTLNGQDRGGGIVATPFGQIDAQSRAIQDSLASQLNFAVNQVACPSDSDANVCYQFANLERSTNLVVGHIQISLQADNGMDFSISCQRMNWSCDVTNMDDGTTMIVLEAPRTGEGMWAVWDTKYVIAPGGQLGVLEMWTDGAYQEQAGISAIGLNPNDLSEGKAMISFMMMPSSTDS